MIKVWKLARLCALLVLSGGCGADPDADVSTQSLVPEARASLLADFAGCAETIGLTSVPASNVRARVPKRFTLANDDESASPLLVRTAHCDQLRLAGRAAGAVTIVQIGALIVSPDGSGDVNSYLFWYDTDNARLAVALRALGLPVEPNGNVIFEEAAAENLATRVHVQIDWPSSPQLSILGLGSGPFESLSPFEVNWWFDGQRAVLMHTHFPTVLVEQAALTMNTPRAGALGRLMGSGSTSFPVRHEFNRIADAHMQVTATR
jgi:hypothetical protein